MRISLPSGLDLRLVIQDNTMKVRVYGSNDWKDYFGHLFAWPRKKLDKTASRKTHRRWLHLAKELEEVLLIAYNLSSVEFIEIEGHSVGGAIISIWLGFTQLYCYVRKAITYNAPKTGINSLNLLTKAHKWDIVRFFPLFFRKYEEVEIYDSSFEWFWKAHNDFEWEM